MIPEPGSCASDAASHASRSAWRFKPQRAEREAVATERAAERGELGAELFADVGDDPVVGGRGAAEHRHGGGVEAVDDLADPPVVGPEVVTPVGDAVDLVDDDQPGSRTDQRHRQVGELRIGEPFGRHEDEVDVVRRDVGGELVDRRRRRAVHRHRAQPEPGRRIDLVAHQRQQRRDEQRRPEPGVAQQARGEEVRPRSCPIRCAGRRARGPGRARAPRRLHADAVGTPRRVAQSADARRRAVRRAHSSDPSPAIVPKGCGDCSGDEPGRRSPDVGSSTSLPPYPRRHRTASRVSADGSHRLPPAFHRACGRRPHRSCTRRRAVALSDGTPGPRQRWVTYSSRDRTKSHAAQPDSSRSVGERPCAPRSAHAAAPSGGSP